MDSGSRGKYLEMERASHSVGILFMSILLENLKMELNLIVKETEVSLSLSSWAPVKSSADGKKELRK